MRPQVERGPKPSLLQLQFSIPVLRIDRAGAARETPTLALLTTWRHSVNSLASLLCTTLVAAADAMPLAAFGQAFPETWQGAPAASR